MKQQNFRKWIKLLIILSFVFLCGQSWANQETPIKIPKKEGSRRFDLEINQINNQAIEKYNQGSFQDAAEKFKKALNISKQLRDPSQGILYYNFSLSLHKAGRHENAAKHFFLAKKFSRGNLRIINSELLKMYECGFNPSIHCKTIIPNSMNIEGSH